MKTLNATIATLGLLAWGGTLHAAHLQGHMQFSARLNGAQEVPAVTTNALGVASLTLNGTMDTLCIRGHFTGLSGPIMGTHIHSGLAGENGPVLVDLTPFITGNTLSAQLTGAAITPEIVAAHVRGELYLNVHTDANMGGEIRGQIIPETDMAMMASLDGMQEVPMVATAGRGLATFLLAKHNGELQYNVVVSGLSGPIQAAHLHNAAAGVNGGVVLDLSASISGNTIRGSADPSAFLADLLAGNIYINVHTMMNAGGEVRGQLRRVMGVPFDTWVTGAQEVPAVTTTGMGVGSFMASADLDSVYYTVQLDGLSGPAQAAHLHLGVVGSNGDVAINLSDGIMGDRIEGSFATAGLGDELLQEMLEGGVYLNVHTAMNAGGEIRGQVYRYMREGYTVELSGAQEVPMNASTATGGGVVTVDRDQSNAHIMVVTDALNVQAAHLHLGDMGENGPVIYSLVPVLMDNGAFTYWTGSDATMPFETANSVQLRSNGVYVNVHTTDFAGGEVRGQVLRGSPCSLLPTAIGERNERVSLAAYPVPSADRVTVQVSDAASIRSVIAYNAQGQAIDLNPSTRQSDRLEFDIQDLASGAYTLLLRTDKGQFTTRIIRK